MKIYPKSLAAAVSLLMTASVFANDNPYQENWDSLARHTAAPKWFQDAKFGIYFHWGAYSVPAYGSEWYPRWMHFSEHKIGKHHLENYGHPSEFGYHDFVPQFKAEQFDAHEWASFSKKQGLASPDR